MDQVRTMASESQFVATHPAAALQSTSAHPSHSMATTSFMTASVNFEMDLGRRKRPVIRAIISER